MLAEVVVVVVVAAASVLTIGERVGVTAEQVTLRPYVLLRVGVLMGEEVSVKRGNVVMRAGIM